MIAKMINKIKALLNSPLQISRSESTMFQLSSVNRKYAYEERAINGRVLELLNKSRVDAIINDINESEFKIYSQWGDDGIINFLINYLDIEITKFVEFGVESYTECNTRFLLVNNNWSGLIMDGSKSNMDSVKSDEIFWKYDLKAIDTFVTAENINQLLSDNGMLGDIGLLHIDIDGNDYWIWKKVEVVNPIIVIVEYNSLFGDVESWTTPYDAAFVRTKAHHSNLYYGVSIQALCDLATEKGYSFIGCNTNGNNAYFVRNDKLKALKAKTAQEGYRLSKFSENRAEDGRIVILRGEDRLKVLHGMPIYDTRLDKLVTIQ